MERIARLGATAIATIALIVAATGCAPGPVESSTEATTVSATSSSASSAPPAAPTVSRPLSDFFEDNPDDSRYSFYSFATPSGQIQCRVVAGTLPCQTEGYPHTVADSALCGSYPGEEQGRAVRFGFVSSQRNQPCATIIQGDGFRSPHTLAYGQSVTAELSSERTVTCTSDVDGLICTQTGGTGAGGFFLSVDSFRVF